MKNDNYVLVAGTFDLFHVGHLNLLRRASRFGSVVATVNTDRFVEEFKKIKPTIHELDRLDVVSNIFFVDYARLNDNADLTKTIQELLLQGYNIAGVVFGDDYDIESYRKQTGITREWQQAFDIALIQLPRTDGVSSSQLREKLA